jgi:hypothetical protein
MYIYFESGERALSEFEDLYGRVTESTNTHYTGVEFSSDIVCKIITRNRRKTIASLLVDSVLHDVHCYVIYK